MVTKYTFYPDINIHWDNSARFDSDEDADRTLRIWIENLRKNLSKYLAASNPKNIAGLAAKHYAYELNINESLLNRELQSLLEKYRQKCLQIRWHRLFFEAKCEYDISSGRYKYLISETLLRNYKQEYRQACENFYTEAFNYVRQHY